MIVNALDAKPEQHTEQVQTIVIGGGQAGLSVAYHLARRGLPFTVLDANERVGDSWRNRWDSLRLFTPALYDSLDGLRFPAPAHYFPTKDEMANYLEAYAARFNLPIRHGIKVDGLSRRGECYVVTAGNQRFEAEQVVVAMATYQKPRVPRFAAELHSRIVQLHSSEYRNPDQLQEGPVLIAGAGNSGAEIALDVANRHRTFLSGRHPGHIPFRIDGIAARRVLQRIALRFVFHRVLTVRTPIGRKARQKILSQGGPLIRVKPANLRAAGVERVPRVSGVRDGLPVLDDGRRMDVANVIWCTGYQPGFSWIDAPVFEQNGMPKHDCGVVTGEPGLYFVGLPFIYAFSSTMIHGVGRDAERIASVIESRVRDAKSRRQPAMSPSAVSVPAHRPRA
jgi:putative flavoprotein involved in K+ transport